MGFVLSDEEGLLKQTASQFFSEKMPVAHLRGLREARAAHGFDPALWREMGSLGLTGLMIDEAHGGTGMGVAGLGIILEEAGRTLAPSPLFATGLVAAAILARGGSAEQKAAHLPQIAAGEVVISPAFDEGAHHAPERIACRAELTRGGVSLSGEKTFVPEGMAADFFVVSAQPPGEARRDGEQSWTELYLVAGDAPGLSRRQMSLADSRGHADVTLQGVKLSRAAMIGQGEASGRLLQWALDLGRAGMAAEMLGGAREVFERTLAHLKERRQFGAPIGSFQALKHRAAQMFCEIELTHSAVREALTALDQERADAARLASLAKERACETARLVTNEGVQLHGGMGMTDEADLGLFLKRARVQAQIFGDARFQRARYAALGGF